MNKSWRVHTKNNLLLASRLSLAFIFLRSAIPHLENPYQFAQSVANYQIFSGVLVSVVAVVIPVLELVVAFALLFVEAWWAFASKTACVLSAVFLAVQLQALTRGLNISCGCFGSGVDHEIGFSSLLQASAVGVLGGICLLSIRPLDASNQAHES